MYHHNQIHEITMPFLLTALQGIDPPKLFISICWFTYIQTLYIKDWFLLHFLFDSIGQETTATTLSFAFQEVYRHPEVLEKYVA